MLSHFQSFALCRVG